MGEQILHRLSGLRIAKAKRRDRRLRQAVGIAQRRKLHKPDAVRKQSGVRSACLDREPRLANAARAGKRDKPRSCQGRADGLQLLVAPDERRKRVRQRGFAGRAGAVPPAFGWTEAFPTKAGSADVGPLSAPAGQPATWFAVACRGCAAPPTAPHSFRKSDRPGGSDRSRRPRQVRPFGLSFHQLGCEALAHRVGGESQPQRPDGVGRQSGLSLLGCKALQQGKIGFRRMSCSWIAPWL